MQSLVGFVISVNQGWQSFEVAMPFQASLYDSKEFFIASAVVALSRIVLDK